MSTNEADTPTPMRALRQGGISLEDRLQIIEELLRDILARENSTATEVALIKAKLALHDTILMGVCGVVGITIVGALLAKVIH